MEERYMKFMTIFSFLLLFLSVPLLGMDAPLRITPINYSKSTETTDSAPYEDLEPLFPTLNLAEPTVEDISALSQQTIQAHAASDTEEEPLDSQTAKSKIKCFKCTECPKTYNSMYDLKNHLLAAHTGHKPYKCPRCAFEVVQKSNLSKHIKSSHPDFPMSAIPKLTDHEKKLVQQILAPFLARFKFSCPSCNQSYDNKTKLDLHVKNAHKQQAFAGEIHNELQVIPHSQVVAPVIPTKTEPQKDTEWKFTAGINVEKEEKFKSYVCSASGCENSFHNIEDLKSHILFYHTSLRPNKCPKCSFATPRRANLIVHMNQCAPEFVVPLINDGMKKQIEIALAPFLAKLNFQCPNCPASFPSKRLLTLHISKEMKSRKQDASSALIDPLNKRAKHNPQDEQ